AFNLNLITFSPVHSELSNHLKTLHLRDQTIAIVARQNQWREFDARERPAAGEGVAAGLALSDPSASPAPDGPAIHGEQRITTENQQDHPERNREFVDDLRGHARPAR